MAILPKQNTYSAWKMGARGRCIFWSSTFPFWVSTSSTGWSLSLPSSRVLFFSRWSRAAENDFSNSCKHPVT
jgi:hypothetical protein